jgi:hypothetical protein
VIDAGCVLGFLVVSPGQEQMDPRKEQMEDAAVKTVADLATQDQLQMAEHLPGAHPLEIEKHDKVNQEQGVIPHVGAAEDQEDDEGQEYDFAEEEASVPYRRCVGWRLLGSTPAISQTLRSCLRN